MNPLEIYYALPEPVKQICIGAAGKILANVVEGSWTALTNKDVAPAFARIYKRWSEELPGDDAKIRAAFEDFFHRETTRKEFEKIPLDRYESIDFEALELEFRTSCRVHGCEPPATDLYQLLEMWVRDLDTLLETYPQYRKPLEKAIRDLDRGEAEVLNDSLAAQLYLKALIRQHRYIRFGGMAELSGPAEVALEKVFVMPRLTPCHDDSGQFSTAKPKPFPAHELLHGNRSAKRAVILGPPGSGKTTLCECLALALAARQSVGFEWARNLPQLFPVFYRVRDLDKDQAEHGTIWDLLRRRYSRLVQKTPAKGFFVRMMEQRGLLVLFDGLDEAASAARRKDIVDLVSQFADQLSGESRVMITSRPHDYQRQRFTEYAHFDLSEFDDDEIQTFIRGWRLAHDPDRAAAEEKAAKLWNAMRARPDIRRLAGNALLLTMIVRVHFGLGELPDSRLELYAKCAETLLKSWAEAADLPKGPLDRHQKEKFLGELAYAMQKEHTEQMKEEGVVLQIGRNDLARRLDRYLKAEAPGVSTEDVIHRLHTRDAILVSFGNDQFGFVHRSFQEYFAAWWMAQRLKEKAFERLVFDEPAGWNETLYMAVAQLDNRRRQAMLLKLLHKNRIEFSLACVRTAPQIDLWLKTLAQFLSKYYWDGQEYEGMSAAECAEACGTRRETTALLRALFDRDNRDGQSLAAAVELAEGLVRRGNPEAQKLLAGFFVEAEQFGLRSVEKMTRVDDFWIDKFLVTNRDFECFVPSHRRERDRYSDADDQPVIYVNWFEANLYCRWRGPGFRLPTEEEWYKAAAWESAKGRYRKYPWSDEFDPERCNTDEKGPGRTTPVGAYPNGISPYGCYDMAGNVWQWTASRHSAEHDQAVLRGGSWYYFENLAASDIRSFNHPHYRSYFVGFRCARTNL